VFDSGVQPDIVPIDVTRRCVLSSEDCARILDAPTPRGELLGQLLKLWQADANHAPTLHDPLAALSLVSNVLKRRPSRVSVTLCGEARGQTRHTEGHHNARVAEDVDEARVVREFMARVLSA
jgi:inosine-uridine nucleoside N-ribohydrolase